MTGGEPPGAVGSRGDGRRGYRGLGSRGYGKRGHRGGGEIFTFFSKDVTKLYLHLK